MDPHQDCRIGALQRITTALLALGEQRLLAHAHRGRALGLHSVPGIEGARPGLVFVTPDGKPQRANVIAAHFMPGMLAKAGLGHYTPHDLHKTACTLVAKRVKGISVAQALLRHRDPTATMKSYRLVGGDEVGTAVKLLEDTLLGASDVDDGGG